ncbi:MAG: pyruvate formate lyase family protein, partial [Clostridia bacterium]|nr:pyruvate formate lyase family protein [Clostridia bacterium]
MLSERLRMMAERYHDHDDYPETVTPAFDRADLLMEDCARQAKRTVEYILAQPVGLRDGDRMLGKLRFNGCVEGDVYVRAGYKNNGELGAQFYKKPFETLATYDAQHSTADFQLVIDQGLEGRLEKIGQSKRAHAGDADALAYLAALETVARGLIERADQCARACEAAMETASPQRREELAEMARILHKVPRRPADSFREAVQSLYFMFQYLPDSIGTPDRYLFKYYQHDLEAGVLTRDEAKELIQELFIMINGARPYSNRWSGDKGGESHFSLGGFTPDGHDGFNDLSRLIVEAMMELPLYRPQVSLRWTPETPIEVLRFVMDAERHDFFKRFAFVNDVPRVKMLMEHIGLKYEDAVRYTMVGCNEPAIQGALYYGGCKSNCVRALTRTLYDCESECVAAETFDDFFEIYARRFKEDMARLAEISDAMNRYRAKDVDMISSIILNGPIEKAKSVTRGGCRDAFAGTDLMGWVTAIDSLIVIRQFVYEEKRFTMAELIKMLRADWEGYEEVRNIIYRHAKFHGNDDPLAKEVAGMLSWMIQDTFRD